MISLVMVVVHKLRDGASEMTFAERNQPITRDQLPMPSQQRVWRDDRGDLAQHSTAQSVCPRGELSSVVIGEPEALSPAIAGARCDSRRSNS